MGMAAALPLGGVERILESAPQVPLCRLADSTRRSAVGGEAEIEAAPDCLGPIAHTESQQDYRYVDLHHTLRDAQTTCDLAIWHADYQSAQDVELTSRQLGRIRACGSERRLALPCRNHDVAGQHRTA